MPVIVTERLELVPATAECVRAALDGPRALEAALGAAVPATWPPEYLDAPALEFTLARLAEGPEHAGWWMYFVLLSAAAAAAAGSRSLIGSGGYVGPPGADGTVEVGYGIVSDQRRRGYATEATRGLLGHAFAQPAVRRVIAHTLPELEPSIGVLHKCGFRLTGAGPEPGVIRFELAREDFLAGGSRPAGGGR